MPDGVAPQECAGFSITANSRRVRPLDCRCNLALPDIVGFVVLSVIIFGLQHAKVMFSDDYSFKRTSVEIAVIATVVLPIVVLVELLW